MSEKTLADCTIKELLCLQVQLLMDMRDALVVEAAHDEGCTHPEEKRISLSTPSDLDHWVCGVPGCRFDNKASTMN